MKHQFYALLCLFLISHNSYTAVYSHPYNQLNQLLPYNDNDICFDEAWIKKLFKYNKITNVVEVGAGFGASTAIFAKLLPTEGKIYAFNSWYGFMPYLDVFSCSNQEYQQFMSNMIHLGLQDKVIPVKTEPLTHSFVDWWFNQIAHPVQLAYVHSTECPVIQLRVVAIAYGLVADNKGVVCGSDWNLDIVKVAVTTLAQKNNLTVYVGDNFWFIKSGDGFAVKSFMTDSSCWNVIV